MSHNASLPFHSKSSKSDGTAVDIDAIMDNVTIVLYTLTVVLGITGNSVVIWVAGFRLKVDSKFLICRNQFLSKDYIEGNPTFDPSVTSQNAKLLHNTNHKQ